MGVNAVAIKRTVFPMLVLASSFWRRVFLSIFLLYASNFPSRFSQRLEDAKFPPCDFLGANDSL